jgi:hypothetical protein
MCDKQSQNNEISILNDKINNIDKNLQIYVKQHINDIKEIIFSELMTQLLDEYKKREENNLGNYKISDTNKSLDI